MPALCRYLYDNNYPWCIIPDIQNGYILYCEMVWVEILLMKFHFEYLDFISSGKHLAQRKIENIPLSRLNYLDII